MMYKDQFVVAIKSGGKVLRETKDLVKLPFGSEFSILVKNLNSRRAEFTVHIDGTDVLGGEKIVVNANSEVELKRYIRNGNMEEGNAFKFIERTQQIEDGPRGIKVDDGVVRVEYWFEKEQPIVNHVYTQHHTLGYPYYWPYYGPQPYWNGHQWIYPSWYNPYGVTYTCSGTGGGVLRSMSMSSGTSTSAMSSNASASVMGNVNSATFGNTTTTTNTTGTATDGNNVKGWDGSVACSNTMSNVSPDSFLVGQNASLPTMDSCEVTQANMSQVINDVGITVPGSKVEQKFTTVYGFDPEEISHVIILRLVGMVGKVAVAKAVTVQSKQKCETCGKVNKSTSRFCSGCGTALEIV